jgi:hypothetical protein
LPIVVVELEVMDRVMGSSIYDIVGGPECTVKSMSPYLRLNVRILLVMDTDGPDLNKDEQDNVKDGLQRQDKGENVIWQRLEVTVLNNC